ncbi:hypothetical protein AB0I28_38750 [Phytomonospora sp. NPDC050363]|uniref:hypothetical protein n=1 Tax=Phytomonospora sp. NPDC050363 TaxID=3155642 RepID=UPI0033F81AD1
MHDTEGRAPGGLTPDPFTRKVSPTGATAFARPITGLSRPPLPSPDGARGPRAPAGRADSPRATVADVRECLAAQPIQASRPVDPPVVDGLSSPDSDVQMLGFSENASELPTGSKPESLGAFTSRALAADSPAPNRRDRNFVGRIRCG